jgi:hypothetical protein
MVPSGIKIGKEQLNILNILAHADCMVLIGIYETDVIQLFVEMENIARKLGLQIKQKTKYDSGKEKHLEKKKETF